MKIENFWVVTEPTKNSELADILFESDIKKMHLQYLGGLRTDEIIGIFSTKEEAEIIARAALAELHKMGSRLTGTLEIELEFSQSLEQFKSIKAAEEYVLVIITSLCKHEWQSGHITLEKLLMKNQTY